jgi:phosphoserine aminotransferase
VELGELVIFATSVFGTLPTWILVVIALVASWRVTRGGAGSAVSELTAANRVLERRIHELGAEVRDLKIENAELRARTDVSIAIEPVAERIVQAITEHEDRALSELAKHEGRAIERHELVMRAGDAQLNVLQLVADRLGPEEAAA